MEFETEYGTYLNRSRQAISNISIDQIASKDVGQRNKNNEILR